MERERDLPLLSIYAIIINIIVLYGEIKFYKQNSEKISDRA